jgi:hypothetical protein
MLRLFIVSLFLATVGSAHDAFTLGTSGCPMAHCSPLAGGNDPSAPPPQAPNHSAGDTNVGSPPFP